jgi:hypothetical protein
MDSMYRFIGRYLLCLLLLNLAACSTMQTVNLQRAVQTSNARGVEYGRMVEVKPIDGRKVKFRVTEITDEGIGNGDGFYRYSDMESLKVENPDSNATEDTLTWVLGAIGIAALIALAVNSDSVSVCSPSPCPEN